MGVKVGGARFLAQITIKELESLTANDAGRVLREDGNLAGRISVRKDGVSVSFFYLYRCGDQNKECACGTWPRKSLTDIGDQGKTGHRIPAATVTVFVG